MPNENLPFIQVQPSQVNPTLRALFSPSDPAALRCFAILDGHAAGKIFTDHPETPTWAIVQEAAFGSLYLAGKITAPLMNQMVTSLQKEGDVLIGMWANDPRWALLPPSPGYSGCTLEFNKRVNDLPLAEVPAGCKLARLNPSLFKQILSRNLLIHMYGSIEQALKWGYGLCLLREDGLLCEAFAGPAAQGVIEIGVETHPRHMRKGYATITCAHLIRLMEGHGYLTYWNCASQNQASIALARKLGYQSEMEYPLLAWFKTETGQGG